MTLANKRSSMTLFTNNTCPYCHQVRIVLAEKAIPFDTEEVKSNVRSDQLSELNPYSSLPTLVDRDLVLYQPNIILEYLEERFPHPPLMPQFPVAKARSRLVIYRVQHDWYQMYESIVAYTGSAAEREAVVKDLRDSIMAVSPVFESSEFFLSEEFSLVDCSLAALLWRLPSIGMDIASMTKPIVKYAERLFARPSFKESLTEAELELQSTHAKSKV